MSKHLDVDAFVASLVPVDGPESVLALPPDTHGVVLRQPSNAVLEALSMHLPQLRHIVSDGNGRFITDHGLAHLARLRALETLDLEWSAVTDAGLPLLASLPSLRWLDIGGAVGVTAAGIAALRASRPHLEIEAGGL